jgi:hypothetical protein
MSNEIDLTPIMEELKLHRPVFPAPGWKVFAVYLDRNAEGGVDVNEITCILGWQVQDDTSFALITPHRSWKQWGDGAVVLEPGEKLNLKAALRTAVLYAAKCIKEQFDSLEDKYKNNFRKKFPGLQGNQLDEQSALKLEEMQDYLETDEVFTEEEQETPAKAA